MDLCAYCRLFGSR
ncbi:hypothetical protein CGLO_10728 [Colletotrichum gloeosporioides Cg-14]|uniref:Uncharacterized protein n=1 Tax=Colletotrichum gloeosporioides (strain Cg-14) TaxID=1237896 RepID=T0K2P4_COLGC|nr:hypothetical protein CGLO_10728 [Colletotrichum gloeosporioides Cg-14]